MNNTPEYEVEVKGVDRKVAVDGDGEVSFFYTNYDEFAGHDESALYLTIEELERVLAQAKEHAYAYSKYKEFDYDESEYHKAVVLYRLTGGKCE